MNNSDMKKIWSWILNNDNFLICSHFSPDGDNIGSSLAIYRLLNSLGKRSIVVNEDIFPDKYTFLLDGERYYQVNEIKESFKNIIILDCGDFKRVGTAENLFDSNATILNIDHHISNDYFGNLNLVDPTKAATVQLVFDLLEANNFQLSKSIAEPLYLGLLTDTGGFRYQNTNSEVLRVASELSKYSINPAQLIEFGIYRNSGDELKRISSLISQFEIDKDLKLMTLLHDNRVDKIEDNDLLLSLLRSVEDVDVILYARQIDDNLVKGSFRSNSFNVSDFSSKFGGGGHKNAAGLRYIGDLSAFNNEVVTQLKKDIRIHENI